MAEPNFLKEIVWRLSIFSLLLCLQPSSTPGFVTLLRDISFVPARQLISEIMPHYEDVDGNFVEQFQTTGFDARLWELYLHSYLVEEQLFLSREFDRPDFLV